ncbi:MAG: branched-chain amino acid ABC transporter substrate-binding protein [Gaiellales bacterium]
MRRAATLGLAVLGLALAGCGLGGGEEAVSESAAPVVADPYLCAGDVAVMAPYGGFGATDSVQMNWARVAIDKFNETHDTSFTLKPYNVDFDLEQGRRAAQRIVADQDVIGVVGPKTSGVTREVGPLFDGAGLVYVSPSATNATLTDGSLRNFYRVVASDALQGPRLGSFIVEELQPSKVLVVANEGEAYSQGLARGITAGLDERGVPHEVVVVDMGQEDYSEVITRVDESVNVLAMPLLDPLDAKRLADELAAAGKYPTIVAGDSLFVSAFAVPGAYVSTYAPDASALPRGREIVRLYESIFGSFEAYGGPAYVAMEVVLTAAYAACAEDGTVTRRGVLTAMPDVRIEETILGTPVAFTPEHELEGATIQVYRIGTRGYELVG